jgi:NitT/TauT family transport system substrate-binding protein
VLAAVVYSAFGDGMKMDLKKFEFVQMPPPAMPAALSTGRVAAASLIQAQSYQALKTGDYKPLISAGDIFKKANGVIVPSSVIASYPEKLKKSPALYHEFLRVLRESRDYAIAHPQEVFAAVGKEVNVEPGFFTWWFQNYEFGYRIDANALKALDLFWGLALKNKWIEHYSPAQSTVWDAIVAKSK